MDGKDFDAFTRRLAAGSSRRGLLRAGLAFAGAAVGHRMAGAGAAAATLRSPGQICRTNGECASGNCGPKDRTGRSRCLCGGPGDCPQPPAGDPCRAATCSPSGQCATVVNTGTPCGDGNACIQNPTCQADGTCVGTPVVCTPLDQCHVAGTCDPATGLCSNPAADFGTPCDDGNACTTGDKCVLGECQGTSTICQPVDDPGGCWIQPVCDPTTGTCTQATPKSSGTPCDDGNLCTTSTCDGAGTCVGVPITCGGSTVGTCPQKCDPATGQCVAGDNGDWCVPSIFGQCETGVCQDGGCVAVPAQVGASCFFSTTPPNPCLTGVCSESGDCVGVSVADGTTCTPATALGECQTGVCQTGACVALSVPDGTLCGSDVAPECSRQSCQAGVCTDVSRIGQRCEVELHGCIYYTCQADGCMPSGETHDCNSTISCGGFGTCTEVLPGVGECIPNVCDDCCGGECGKTKCTYPNGGLEVCRPTNQVCAGQCYNEPITCCGIELPGTILEHITTCQPAQHCCLSASGQYHCCEAHQTCGQFSCGTN